MRYATRDEWNRFLEDFMSFSPLRSDVDMRPPVNLTHDEEAVNIQLLVPGIKTDDVDLTVKEDILTVRYEMGETPDGEEGRPVGRERPYGSFHRRIRLPYRVESESILAKTENGVISLRLPRAESDKPVTIKINAA